MGWTGLLLRVRAPLPSFSSILPARWCSGQMGDPGARTSSLDKPPWRSVCVCVNSRCLSASVCHPAAAALCARACDTRTATYRSLLVFAFQKAATVSVVQWVSLSGFRVAANATHLGKNNSKSAAFFGSPKQDFITKQVSEWCQIMMDITSLSEETS